MKKGDCMLTKKGKILMEVARETRIRHPYEDEVNRMQAHRIYLKAYREEQAEIAEDIRNTFASEIEVLPDKWVDEEMLHMIEEARKEREKFNKLMEDKRREKAEAEADKAESAEVNTNEEYVNAEKVEKKKEKKDRKTKKN